MNFLCAYFGTYPDDIRFIPNPPLELQLAAVARRAEAIDGIQYPDRTAVIAVLNTITDDIVTAAYNKKAVGVD